MRASQCPALTSQRCSWKVGSAGCASWVSVGSVSRAPAGLQLEGSTWTPLRQRSASSARRRMRRSCGGSHPCAQGTCRSLYAAHHRLGPATTATGSARATTATTVFTRACRPGMATATPATRATPIQMSRTATRMAVPPRLHSAYSTASTRRRCTCPQSRVTSGGAPSTGRSARCRPHFPLPLRMEGMGMPDGFVLARSPTSRWASRCSASAGWSPFRRAATRACGAVHWPRFRRAPRRSLQCCGPSRITFGFPPGNSSSLSSLRRQARSLPQRSLSARWQRTP